MNAVERLFMFNDDGIGLDDDGRIGAASQSEADASKSGGAKRFEHDGESFCKMDSLTLRRSSVWDVTGESEKCFLSCQPPEVRCSLAAILWKEKSGRGRPLRDALHKPCDVSRARINRVA